jgi:hypothetical protein
VLLAVCYFILRLILRIAPVDDAKEREAEILVLRHQPAVLKRMLFALAYLLLRRLLQLVAGSSTDRWLPSVSRC